MFEKRLDFFFVSSLGYQCTPDVNILDFPPYQYIPDIKNLDFCFVSALAYQYIQDIKLR